MFNARLASSLYNRSLDLDILDLLGGAEEVRKEAIALKRQLKHPRGTKFKDGDDPEEDESADESS